MVIKVKADTQVKYKSSKKILTPRDIREADSFDTKLNHEIKQIEKILLKRQMLSVQARKTDMLQAWYLIGTRINAFLKNHKVSLEDETIFWNSLYGRSSLINKTVPTSKISKTRNDFRIASMLARHPFSKLKKIGFWALWREILTYKAFKDERVLEWVVKKIENLSPETRDQARPFLKAVSTRLKRIDTSVLSDKELLNKFKTIQ